MTPLGGDLERIVPDLMTAGDALDRETLALHVERYEWASRYATGRSVLDLACGVGYGSELLARAGATSVLGVDRDAEAVAYATTRYGRPGLSFETSDAFSFSPGRRFSLVVSFETIEHVGDPTGLVDRLATLVEPGGVFVGSVPVTVSTDVNPFHAHDFTEDEFLMLVRRAGLRPRDEWVQVQRFSPIAVLRPRPEGSRRLALRRGLLRHYLQHPGLALRRGRETLRHGFCNRYLLVAADRP